jgi:YD repeat-containing protein
LSAGESNPQSQDQSPSNEPASERTVPEQEYEDQVKSGEDPDVLLDVPVLKVEEISLELKDLRVHVSLRANLADLVSVDVGVDAYLEEAKLEIKGVEAQALLKVRLDRVLDTFNRALDTIDRNPEILGGISRGAGDSEEEAPRANDEAEDFIPDTPSLDEAGQTIQRTVDEAGNIMETTLDDSGAVTGEEVTGNVGDLPVEQEYIDEEGQVVAQARDDLGNLVERTLDEEGNAIDSSMPENDGKSNEPDSGGNAADDMEATEAAERKARELGVDLSIVEGTGSGGRIIVKDIEDAAGRQT